MASHKKCFDSLLVKILLCSLFFIPQIYAQTYHFASIDGLIDQEIAEIVMKVVYQRSGFELVVTRMPGIRAQKEADSGRVDGEVMRIYGYGEQTPNVIRVPTSFYYVITAAFAHKDSNITLNSKEDLKKYTLVKVRGVKHTDAITQGLPKENLVDLIDPTAMMTFLIQGRADLALSNPLEGKLVLLKLENDQIQKIDKNLAKLDLYHYIS